MQFEKISIRCWILYCSLDKIREQYEVLTNCPVNKLLPSLYNNTLDDKMMEAKPLEKDRMVYLLDDVLICCFNIGYGSKYNGLLKVGNLVSSIE